MTYPYRLRIAGLFCLGLLLGPMTPASHAQTFLDKIKIGRHKQTQQDPVHPCFGKNWPPTNMIQLANCIDILEEGIRDDGILVIQQPSVWGQARMTLYRKDFEQGMRAELKNFQFVLSARVARTDQASYESQTALGASLSPTGGGKGSSSSSSSTTVSVPDALGNLSNMIKASDANNVLDREKSLALLNTAFGNVSIGQPGNLGLDPPIYLDEKKRYLDHLNEIRRVNMGDDNSDSAGYGMYLVRMPASIDPGEKTREGHGGILSVTAHHDFAPQFLQRTFRNLVINDIIDELTPIVYDLIESGAVDYVNNAFESKEGESTGPEMLPVPRKVPGDAGPATGYGPLTLQSVRFQNSVESPKTPSKSHFFNRLMTLGLAPGRERPQQTAFISPPSKGPQGESSPVRGSVTTPLDLEIESKVRNIKENSHSRRTSAKVTGQVYPIAPSDRVNVFCYGNLLLIGNAAQQAQTTSLPRATDIRSLLEHELEYAYDLMEKGIGQGSPLANGFLMDSIVRHFHSRAFFDDPASNDCLQADFNVLMAMLGMKVIDKPCGALAWAIAVDAALLNERLQEEIHRLAGCHNLQCPPDVDVVQFYLPPFEACTPAGLHAEEVFEEYVKVRWPMITFAIDPVVDQQNIADAFSRHRELQLAMAFAFSTGQISFNQLMRFQRRLEMDAETIALNRTVTGFSHGSDTFGWKFTPRFQNPPEEKNNLVVMANILYRTGPGRDFGIRHSRLEVGQRELTAVVVMPSFLNQVRMDVSANWFRLANPDDMRITTSRQLELGRYVKELRDVQGVCDTERYRPNDIQNLLSKLEQIEKMLPLQTHVVPVPYENTLGGFALFGQGHTALVPELIGYEGIDTVPLATSAANAPAQGQGGNNSASGATASVSATVTASVNPTAATAAPSAAPGKSATGFDAILYGKHFSVAESTVVVGGQVLQPVDSTGAPTLGQVDIISREVAHIQIPASVLPTLIKGKVGDQPAIEVVLATPNGVSNRLLIPVQKAATTAAFTLKSTDVTATLSADGKSVSVDKALTITQTTPAGMWPSKASVNLILTNSTGLPLPGVTANATGPTTPTDQTFTVAPDQLASSIQSTLLDANAGWIAQLKTQPSVSVPVQLISIAPNVTGIQPIYVSVSGQLKLTFAAAKAPATAAPASK